MPPERLRCPYCGQVVELVWIHGHAQCAACGTNVDECCRGEQALEDESGASWG
jgi:rRNA maturation endonuclease Nob1